MSKKIGIITLGCKVNQYESEAFAEALRARGYDTCDGGVPCDGYIVNTCTVTAEADRKSRQMIRRAARANSHAPIVVTGCTAEYSAKELSEIEGVIAVCGNAKKLECIDLLDEYFAGTGKDHPLINVLPLESASFEKMSLKAFPRTRVYIKIEDGCDNRCSYCAIPGARGNVRSKAPEDVLREVRGFVDAGCKEIVLTGIETASYGKDIEGFDLGLLLRLVDSVAGDCKIRLGSLDPSVFKDRFVDQIKDLPSLAPHFHISLQSGSSKILALMKRKYNAEGAKAAISRLREAFPDAMFTTDVIVGFPGETEEDFLDTLKFMREARFLSAHIFPYSEREGTFAASLPDSVPVEVRRDRASRLIELQNEIRSSILDSEIERESERNVLFETFSNGKAYGHTDSFLEVCVETKADIHGKLRHVTLTHHDGNICHGKLACDEHEKAAYVPTRKVGVIKGFSVCNDDYLMRINRDLELGASFEEMDCLRVFLKNKKDPTVAELYYHLAALREISDTLGKNYVTDSVLTDDENVRELLSSLFGRISAEKSNASDYFSCTEIAEYAATGKIVQDKCGIFICESHDRVFPPVYSGNCETITLGRYAITLSSGNPLSSLVKGDICAIISPKDGYNIDRFITDVQKLCARFAESDPHSAYISSSGRGFANDLQNISQGILIDASLLPAPSVFAEDALKPLNPSIMIFTERSKLTELHRLAVEFGVNLCAPAVLKGSGVTIKAAEGKIFFNAEDDSLRNGGLPKITKFDPNVTLESQPFGSPVEYPISLANSFLSAREVGGDDLYGDLADAMGDSRSVYAICGTIDPRDSAWMPAVLTLDAFRRNNSPNIVYSRFFFGEKTSICVIKLSEKK